MKTLAVLALLLGSLAATTAVSLGMNPDLVGSAALVSCSYDLVAWRASNKSAASS